MKKTFLYLLPLFCFSLFFSSCNKKDKTGLLVPKDAAFVMHVNSSSLSSKLSWKEIKATNWFQKIISEHHDSLSEKLMNDPAQSGIDMNSDFVYFIQMRKSGAHLVIDGKLKDMAAFENYCKRMMPDAAITKDGNFSAAAIGKEMAIIWNKDWFAYAIDLPGMNRSSGFERRDFMESGPDKDKDFMPPGSDFNADSLKKIGKEVLSLSDTKTLGTDERFADLVKEPGDIHFWMNPEKLYSAGAIGMYMSMMKVSSLLKGNIATATINFDNGKIVAKGKQYYGDEMNRLVKKYRPQPVTASLINRLPSDDIMAVIACNFSPEGLQEILKMTGMDGLLNLYLSKENFSLDDFVKANKGELLFALTNVETKISEDTMFTGKDKKQPMIIPLRKPEIKFLLANAINNKGAFDRLMEVLKGESGGFNKGPIENFTYQVKDNWFAAGDPDNVTAFLSGNNTHISFADRIAGHPLGCYINIQKILNSAFENRKSSTNTALFDASMNMWQDAVITGGDYKDGSVAYTAEVNFVNKNTNSLKQLNQYIDQIASIYESRFAHNKMEMDRIIDSLKTEKKMKVK